MNKKALSRREFLWSMLWVAATVWVKTPVHDILSLLWPHLDISLEFDESSEKEIRELALYFQKYPEFVPRYCSELFDLWKNSFPDISRVPLESISHDAVRSWVERTYIQQAEGLKREYQEYFHLLPLNIQNRIPDLLRIEPECWSLTEFFRLKEMHGIEVELDGLLSFYHEFPERDLDWWYMSLTFEWLPKSSFNTGGIYYYVDIVMDVPWLGWLTKWIRTQNASLAFTMYDLSEDKAKQKVYEEGSPTIDPKEIRNRDMLKKSPDKILENLKIQDAVMSFKSFILSHTSLVSVDSYNVLYWPNRINEILKPTIN